jgi:hypothetical protein
MICAKFATSESDHFTLCFQRKFSPSHLAGIPAPEIFNWRERNNVSSMEQVCRGSFITLP